MRILNLYAGIGGNRKLWGDEHEITAVEWSPEIISVYRELYPGDKAIACDAHQYLLDHYQEFDFIWSSPPCPSHGQYRFNVGVKAKGYKALYPDMKLYEEIIFLQHYFKGSFVVENTKPYYEPLIKPSAAINRHLFWSNFEIGSITLPAKGIRTKNKISDYGELGDMLANTKVTNKRQVLRNCVEPELGAHILNQVPTTDKIKEDA